MSNSNQGEIYAGDIGTEILIDMQEDISMATNIKLHVKRPSSKDNNNLGIVFWRPEIYSNRYLKYIIKDGDLDIPGEYKIQPELTLLGWSGFGKTVKFKVYEKWK
ncbi:MAG: hypothetical protein HQK79_20185 [Desulfobacterales bacterium]|nr:hypothetical protein [Desulfobacterales bacterium]